MLRDIRAAEINPTRKGESVRVRINQPSTTASIWEPIPTRVVETHTKAKLRCRKTSRGYAARAKVAFTMDNQLPLKESRTQVKARVNGPFRRFQK